MDSGEFSSVKAKRDDLRMKLLELAGGKRAFEECYDLLVGEKIYLEEQVATLDGDSGSFFEANWDFGGR